MWAITVDTYDATQPTAAGTAFLKHYQQVRMLETGLNQALTGTAQVRPQQLAIGINADSLDYWFFDAVAPLLKETNLLIDLRVADQEQTQRYLRDGDVVGCISTESRAMSGCRVDALGQMHYRMLATPEFISRWFPDGVTDSALERAPAVLFNRSDSLHQKFLDRYLSPHPCTVPANYIPAPNQYLQVIEAGCCYGMVPAWQGQDLQDSGVLHELMPGAEISVELYWHRWNIAAPALELLTGALLECGKKYL